MTLEEAIKTAIEFEIRVQKTYKDAAGKLTDPVGQKVFNVLADEEQGHVDFLQHQLKTWQDTGKVSGDLDTVVPSKDTIAAGTKKLEAGLESKRAASTEELELLQKALDMEMEVSAFYRKLVSELDEVGKKFFTRFLEIEDGHVAIVQAEIDAVSGLGYWFDFPEFRLEAG